jgi:hypothetical protein
MSQLEQVEAILQYALENNISIQAASISLDRGKNYVHQAMSAIHKLDHDAQVKDVINMYQYLSNKRSGGVKSLASTGQIMKVHTNEYNIEGKHIVIPCLHSPFNHEELTTACIELCKDLKGEIVGFHILGDFEDMNSLSSHDRGRMPLPGVSLSFEHEEANALLDRFDSVLGKTVSKTYIWGNHEDRFKRYMASVDNYKLGNSLDSPTHALKLVDRGYDVFENWKDDHITIGKHLDLMHGEFCNIHTAKKHIDTYRRSIMFCHTHRIQNYNEGKFQGWNIGTMSNWNLPAFNYATRAMKNTWNNGFAVVDIDADGYAFVHQVIWTNNKFIFNGKEYEGKDQVI